MYQEFARLREGAFDNAALVQPAVHDLGCRLLCLLTGWSTLCAAPEDWEMDPVRAKGLREAHCAARARRSAAPIGWHAWRSGMSFGYAEKTFSDGLHLRQADRRRHPAPPPRVAVGCDGARAGHRDVVAFVQDAEWPPAIVGLRLAMP